MSETSQNGWPASKVPATIHIVPLSVAGVEFVGGCRSGDVHTVLAHVLGQFHVRVQPLRAGQCFGWAYRPNRNNPSKLSNHSSGTAADANSVLHPNGVDASKTFTKAQVAECHKILAEIPELAEVVHWGGDWHEPELTPDPMHWEIHDHDLAKLARVAARINGAQKESAVATNWSVTRGRLLAALNAKEARDIPLTRPAIYAFLIVTRRRLAKLPKS